MDSISVADTNLSCIDVQYAEDVYIADSDFSDCGTPGDTGQPGINLEAGDES